MKRPEKREGERIGGGEEFQVAPYRSVPRARVLRRLIKFDTEGHASSPENCGRLRIVYKQRSVLSPRGIAAK